jgi:hypothetical protein
MRFTTSFSYFNLKLGIYWLLIWLTLLSCYHIYVISLQVYWKFIRSNCSTMSL